MQHAEKKYAVTSFEHIKRQLAATGAAPTKTDASMHYYAQQPGNTVVKLVVYKDRSEIHILDEQDGIFSLREKIPVKDKNTGLQWLKDKGYVQVGLVKMAYTDYACQGGIVGLYTLNDAVYSVILDFPPGEHARLEKDMGLSTAEVISVPYNKYLAERGRFEIIAL